MGDIVSLQAQLSQFSAEGEVCICIEHIDKSVTQLKTSP